MIFDNIGTIYHKLVKHKLTAVDFYRGKYLFTISISNRLISYQLELDEIIQPNNLYNLAPTDVLIVGFIYYHQHQLKLSIGHNLLSALRKNNYVINDIAITTVNLDLLSPTYLINNKYKFTTNEILCNLPLMSLLPPQERFNLGLNIILEEN